MKPYVTKPCVMKKVAIIGASGYSGAQMVKLCNQHPHITLKHVFVSEKSADAGKHFSTLYPQLAPIVPTVVSSCSADNHTAEANDASLTLKPLSLDACSALAAEMDAIFLCTPPSASQAYMPFLKSGQAKIYDLSGSYRLSDFDTAAKHYGFDESHHALLADCTYALPEHVQAMHLTQTHLFALPGCYPTAALLALKPLQSANLLAANHAVVINAVSGVSGVGRKAQLGTSFCEVSLAPYKLFSHRHQPEIEEQLQHPVVFIPHVCNFSQGLMATCTATITPGATREDIAALFEQCYQDHPLVRVLNRLPAINDVVNTPSAAIGFEYCSRTQILVVVCVIDNLLKGAASQAIQVFNQSFGWSSEEGLI